MTVSQKEIQLLVIVVLAVQIWPSMDVYAQDPVTPKVLACYYNASSYFREGMPFQPSNISPFCTHIIYSLMGMREENYNVYSRNPFLDLGPGSIEPYPDDPENSQGDLDMIRKTVQLRDKNPLLKVLASIGGPEQTSLSFSNMARHIANRTLFIRSVMKFVDLYDLDGIDLYWKYPGFNGGRQEDIETFVIVIKELRAAFTNLTTFTSRPYTLTAALGCTQDVIDAGYDVTQLAEYVDFFNLLCFDFKMYTDATRNIGHHSPLFHKESDSDSDKKLTVAFGVNYFLQLGPVSEKLVLGISTRSRTYELGDPDFNDFGNPTRGPGPAGRYTQQTGLLSFFEVCDEVKRNWNEWNFRYDHDYKISSLYNKNDMMWVGGENEISAKEKVDFAMSNNLGGVMVDFIDLDDYDNLCEGWVPYALISAIRERLNFWERKGTKSGK